MHVYRDMVRFGMIDVVVATGASIIDMDFSKRLGSSTIRPRRRSTTATCGALYRRIYDTYIDEEELQACDGRIRRS